MDFLPDGYISQLHNIIHRYTFFKDLDSRRDLLISCGLSDLTYDLRGNHTQREFAQWLFARLTENWRCSLPEELWCVKVFAYMMAVPANLQPEDLSILKDVIEACKKKREETLLFQQKMEQIPLQRAPVRSHHRTSSPRSRSNTYPNHNVREMIVTGYDLEALMVHFRTVISIGTASAFVFEHKEDLLREYIFKRAGREFYNLIQRKPFHIDVPLYQRALSGPLNFETIIEEEIIRLYTCKTLRELFITKHPKDHIACTIWNHYLPASDMHRAATAFWQKVRQFMVPHLQEHDLSMVLFLAHLPIDGIPPLADFTSLQLSEGFTMKENLFPWVEGRLSSINVKKEDIKLYLRRLSNPSQPFEIFGELRHIADEVQENYNQGKYNRRRSRV